MKCAEITDKVIDWHDGRLGDFHENPKLQCGDFPIRDRDGIAHIIPNSKLIGDNFMRLQGKMACRHMFECTIAPGANLPMVKTDIETLAANVLTKRGWIAQGYSPQVMFMGSTALGTTASIRIFISDIEYAVRSMDAVMCAISDRGYLADVRQDTKPEWR